MEEEYISVKRPMCKDIKDISNYSDINSNNYEEIYNKCFTINNNSDDENLEFSYNSEEEEEI